MQGCRDQEEEGGQRPLVEDDMAGGGDLGDGTVRQPAALTPVCSALPVSAAVTQSRSHAPSGAEDLAPPPAGGPLKRGSLQGGSPPSRAPSSSSSSNGLYSRLPPEGERMGGAPWRRLTRTQSTADLSKDELRTRLQEVTEESELLRCELEVTRRYLEGKYEALKILQGQAILDKATGHTKNLLQKSEERAKALEKEVNGLQWEVTFNQVQMKNFEQSWQQKYDRVCTENRALSDSLGGRAREVQELRAENAALNQQCLELLSMLSVREKKAFQGSTVPPCGRGREVTALELGVLGACQCPGAREPCPCARTAASSRKHVLQLRHELDSQRRRNEEALMMADAFRIAFEQQLRKRSDHFLLRAADAADRIKREGRPSRKSEGAHRIVVQKLRELLPSSTQLQLSDEPADILNKLLDLLNDKEEALAHQRKVSLMLARSTEELERRLQPHEHAHHRKPESHLHCKPSVSEPKDCVHCKPPPSAPESHLHCQPPPSASESHLHCQPPPSAPKSHLHCKPPPSASESHLHCQPPPSASESHLHCKPPPSAPESHLHCQPPPSASESHLHCQPPPSASESHLHCQPPPSASESHLHCQPPPSASESHLQEHLQLPETACDSRYQHSESKQHLHQSIAASVPKPLQHQSIAASVPKPLQHQSIAASVTKPLQPRRNCACGNTRDAPH